MSTMEFTDLAAEAETYDTIGAVGETTFEENHLSTSSLSRRTVYENVEFTNLAAEAESYDTIEAVGETTFEGKHVASNPFAIRTQNKNDETDKQNGFKGPICGKFKKFSSRTCNIVLLVVLMVLILSNVITVMAVYNSWGKNGIVECNSRQCKHGNITDKINGYNCTCDPGYTGESCDIDINECMSQPCMHGICVDKVNAYSCSCFSGFSGFLCDKNIDDCVSEPCNNGTCVDGLGNFTCFCHPGFSGSNCENEIDECGSNPCVRGTCVDGIDQYICICESSFTGVNCDKVGIAWMAYTILLLFNDVAVAASDCYDVLKMDIGRESGTYWIKLWISGRELEVFCDMETENGGWTVFQLRFDGSLEFHRNFADYTNGFGNVHGEFWLGLQNIYEMASQGQSELRIDLEAADGTKAYELFQNFSLSPGKDYTLHISDGTGTAGTGTEGLSYHNGRPFSTYDHGSYSQCASIEMDYGGWWYYNCAFANLNGKYVTPGTINPTRDEGGVTYRKFQGVKSLKQTKMMFRRIR